MKTTLNLPDDLIKEGMKITNSRTKTDLVVNSIRNMIKQRKLERLKEFRGKVELEIDLDLLRKR